MKRETTKGEGDKYDPSGKCVILPKRNCFQELEHKVVSLLCLRKLKCQLQMRQ